MLEDPDCAMFGRSGPYQIRQFVTRALYEFRKVLILFVTKKHKTINIL